MKIYVCIKQVPDTETNVHVANNGQSINTSSTKWIMNPYDEYAVEEALKSKAQGIGTSITVISLGDKSRVVDSLRTALAMGADDAIMIDAPQTDILTVAKAIANAIQAHDANYSTIFTGKQAIDTNSAGFSQMLADNLTIPHVTVVTKFTAQEKTALVEREVEGGNKEIYEVHLPAVIATNKGLNNPRYPSLPGIMKAKKKPIKNLTLADLSVTPKTRTVFTNYRLPAEKKPVQMLDGDVATQATTLIQRLREVDKVL